MTEAEWLASDDIEAMFLHMSELGYEPEVIRKWFLWACASLRRGWEHLPDPRSRRAVEVTEAYAEGLADEDELTAAFEAARGVENEIVAAHPQEDVHRTADPALAYPLAAA